MGHSRMFNPPQCKRLVKYDVAFDLTCDRDSVCELAVRNVETARANDQNPPWKWRRLPDMT